MWIDYGSNFPYNHMGGHKKVIRRRVRLVYSMIGTTYKSGFLEGTYSSFTACVLRKASIITFSQVEL
jgi:hypothetical protein